MKTGLERHSRQAASGPASRSRRRQKVAADSALQRRIDEGARMRRQRERIDRSFGQPAQRAVDEEELLQGKFPLQRQGPEEEELLQGWFDRPLQREALEDEEMLQGKFGAPVQREDEATAPNRTGLPDGLKHGLESLSGYDMSDLRVHYDSAKPGQLDAHAYAQGSDIHLGPGQQRHLPHEAWHTVQQRQGRVSPTLTLGGAQINDDPALEREADVMGDKAARFTK